MLEFATHFGYLGIILFLALTGAGLPVPEEVAVIAAGVLANQEVLNPGFALLSCLVGALLGDSVMYAIGYHFGHGWFRKHPRFAHLWHVEREQQIEEMMRRHGLKVFFVARFLVGLRCPVYLTAGILRVPYRRFLLVDAIAASAVVSIFFGLSYAFADKIVGWFKIIRGAEAAATVVVVLVAAGIAFYYWRRHKKKLQNKVLAGELKEGSQGEKPSGPSRHPEHVA